MHRFRKKSESSRSPPLQSHTHPDPFPQIPLPDNFRTSLILPDLSRRFSLLRSSSGEPVGLAVLRDRLADQRKRGAATQITEEEEELIFDTLRNFPSNSPSPGQRSDENINSTATISVRQSSSTMQSSLSSTSNRSTKRYSNNLFGSGRFNDYNYVRSVTKSSRMSSSTPSKSNSNYQNDNPDSLRPSTPESRRATSVHSQSNSIDSSDSSVRSAPLMAPTPYGEQQQHLVSVAEYRISKALGPSALKRASMALEAAIKEFEEEAEEILMPRTRMSAQSSQPSEPARTSLYQSSIVEPVVAISPDNQLESDPVNRHSSPVPTRTLPGYVPGMPRPMTPREFDLDEQRSHSTTPRATSPNVTSLADSSVSVTRRRSISLASQLGTRPPTSPLFLQRSPNSGRFTPDDVNATKPESPLGSPLFDRRRPVPPLAGPPFQPMAVSSRPATPSTVTWNPNIDASRSTHSKNDSWNSDMSFSSTHDRYTASTRNIHSPSLPDSPTEKNGFFNALEASFSNSINKMTQSRISASPMSVSEFGSPVRAHQRSVTPTQSTSRSPTSPSFPNFTHSTTGSQRSSQQHTPSSSVPPLVFSPLVNSSRSSLGSDGSSYHSLYARDEDSSSLLFRDPDTHPSVWHDLSSPPTSFPGDSPEEKWNPEEVVVRATGLKRADFVAIQEKLLSARDAKEKEKDSGRLEPQERAASSLRKRRPSTSQSSYSYKDRESRIVSPSPQVSPVKQPGMPNRDRPSSALGNATSPSSPREKSSFVRGDISPIARRNRDLAQALFGHEAESTNVSKNEIAIPERLAPPTKALGPASANNDTHGSTSTLAPATAPLSPIRVAPYQTARNPSVPRIPQTPQEEAKLVQEVKEKIDAATELLKPLKSSGKHSPDPQATISRRRINPNQISTPRLVSASTTVVDTIPISPPSIASTNTSGPSKIGSRFKKLRGTLRAKSSQPSPDEPSFSLLDTATQVVSYDSAKLRAPSSAIKIPAPSPPASAGPGLKGFMARLRGKQKPTAAEPASSRVPTLTPQSTSPVPPASLHDKSLLPHTSQKPASISCPETPQVQPLAPPEKTPTQTTYEASAPAHAPEPEPAAAAATAVSQSSDMSALRQLFEAADKIGLDQGELTSLLARSGSTSSKANWTALARNNSAVRQGAVSPTDHAAASLSSSIGRPMYEAQNMRAATPDPNGRTSLDGQGSRDKSLPRPGSRKQNDHTHTRRPREGKVQGDSNAVVRKTIIVPDTNMTADELKIFMEKSMPGRRLSITSISSRSVHDRAPTPPPPRSPTFKRFSGPSPPVPSLPPAFGGNALSVPAAAAGGPIEKSNSTYDSLYDMYAGETRSPNVTPNEPGPSRPSQDEPGVASSDSGAAVELIHLANGETIWNIVNGLREEDDDESVYTRRTSFASEYGARGTNGEGLQVFVKEHGRSGSRGSTSSSFLSRKRGQGKSRPETKVFYTPAEGIGRLIQDLSQNMEAGSFNFAIRQGVSGHSPTSSLSTNEMMMSVEERLEKMIDTVRVK